MVSPLAEVLDALARSVIPDSEDDATLGEIALHAHQVEAVAQARAAIRTYGGTLLADDPGLGKTYVALAVAAAYPRRIVAAPAALRAMWADAMRRTGVACEFVSLESLSRGRAPSPSPLLIVDEAHRASATSAKRYRVLAALAHHAHVLLITATPVRNRRDELAALLALFMGHEAARVDDTTLARCMVRRRSSAAHAPLPDTVHARVMRPRGDARIAAALRSLPPPMPLADGAPAAALISMTLARCWASSIASLDRALWRRLQRGAAISATLDAGRLPSRAELSAWVVGDDAMQMAFPFVATTPVQSEIGELRDRLQSHLDALEALRAISRQSRAADTLWRARRLGAICARHRDSTIIAFSTSEATATALFSALRTERGVVLLTGDEARSAAGGLQRADVLDALGGDARPGSLDCRLVIATDLLAEGVNLQRASVVVHLDDPWTPAGIAQRIGRSARLGSLHERVAVYRFAPSRTADELIQLGERHLRKRRASTRALSPGMSAQAIRDAVRPWRMRRSVVARAVVAAAEATRGGILARVDEGPGSRLVAGLERGHMRWTMTDDPSRVLRLLGVSTTVVARLPTRDEIAAATQTVLRWLVRQRAGDGLSSHLQSVARRRLLARLDLMLAGGASSARPALAARVNRIRNVLAESRGAGVDLRISALLGRPGNDADWLDEVERLLSPCATDRDSRSAPPEVVALLFLRRHEAIAELAPVPSRAPPAASTETAAPR
jgi:superfamily II DNA or RNA helicase